MNKETNSTPSLYEQLKEFRGAIQEVADRHKCHRDWVWKVLCKGQYKDEGLELTASKVLIERKNKRKQINETKQKALAMIV